MARFRYLCNHEAAHAVVGHFLGLRIKQVVICKTVGADRFGGYCVYDSVGRRQKLQLGIMLAAGTVSDKLTRCGRECDEVDRQLALGAGFRDEDFVMLEAAAKSLLLGRLNRSWRDVAYALRERDLTGAEVRAFVGRPLL